MSDHAQDPPTTLVEAEEQFRQFLGVNRFPQKVRWILPDQIALTNDRKYLIRADGVHHGRKEAERRYSLGLEKGLGICLSVICATDTTTIASIYVPRDQLDAQHHLMGPRLKLSCPIDMLPASIVYDVTEWESLGCDVQSRSRMMRELFEL